MRVINNIQIKHYVRLVCVLSIMLGTISCDGPVVSEAKASKTHQHHHAKHLNHYICPMHPTIIKNESGRCPICGMDLIAKAAPSLLFSGSPTTENPYQVVKLTSAVVQNLGVRTVKVKQGRLTKVIKTVGYVAYNERRLKVVTVGTEGWIENLSARRLGLSVEKGQLMMELYSPEFIKVQKIFIQAQKKDKSGVLMKYAQRSESVSPRDRLRYMHVSDSMINQIARKGKPKGRLPIYAPMHGTIIRHNIHKHMYVYKDYPMLTIADLSTVWVEANVYEHQLSWVERGFKAEIEVKALPGRLFTGQVVYIYPELDAKTRTLKVRILVPNPDLLLKPNMYSEVRIMGGQKSNLLKIPREALIVTGKRESVVLDLGEGRYQPVDVVSGLFSQGQVEILTGLKKDDRVVVSGQFLIDSESNLQASFIRFSAN